MTIFNYNVLPVTETRKEHMIGSSYLHNFYKDGILSSFYIIFTNKKYLKNLISNLENINAGNTTYPHIRQEVIRKIWLKVGF